MFMNFSIEQLQSFVAVYEQGSFSKAAQELDKHRTTIGQVISNLEDELAVELFERVGRTAQPTEDATLLYRYAKQVIEQAKSFDMLALSLSYGELESITVAYNSFLPPRAISHVRRKLLELHPNMKVNFIIRNRREILEGIKEDSIQFGLVNIDDRSLMSSIDSTLVNNITFGVFVSKDHEVLNLPEDQRWAALKSQKQIVIKGMIEDNMEKKTISSSDFEVVDQLTLALELIRDNVGWGLLPRLVTYTDFNADELVEVELSVMKEKFRVPMAVCSAHSKHLRALHSEIVSTLVSYTERVNREALEKYGVSN
ncbi:LysR family transcriptional regulator [Vibrio maritimus]|uniref:LysR family transcriptional regulator n=1 Tax=Vibrio maritimus TaxID=990268 RepID=UPI001F447265|nr:LysR family transcriptional regulator [Vibrio maritimus]